MSYAQAEIFDKTRSFSSAAVTLVVVASVILDRQINGSSIGWQVVIALIALAIGIPHGALDHLVTLPKSSFPKMAVFISIYVVIAALSVWAILTWNVLGFIGVVVMSALHFGVGDAAFIAERDRASKEKIAARPAQMAYALAAGSMPVIIPLTNERSTSALAAVNEELVDWHLGFDSELMYGVMGIATLALFILAASHRWRDIVDLLILSSLAFFTPPLVAFAAYFGLWHAMRHTARLTLNLESSKKSILANRPGQAFRQAVIPGIPALLGTFAVSLFLGFQTSDQLSDDFLWLTLVIVWALTVPHMMVTAKLDRAAL